jgi:hypothetical protein
MEMLAALVRLAQDAQEIGEQAENAISFLKLKGFGNPRPGMPVYRIAGGKDGREMLCVDGQEMLGLSELYASKLHDDRQCGVRQRAQMACNVLAATVARPQYLEYRRLERLDGLVDESGVLREQPLLLFDDGEMPVQVAGLLEPFRATCSAAPDP